MYRRKIAALRGILGAFLGAFLSTALWLMLLPYVRWMGSLAILPAFLPGPAACFGYWLLRGLRHRKFACLAAYACTIAGVAAGCLLLGVSAESVFLCLVWNLLAILGARPAQGRLLKYTDPAWYADPRRVAVLRAGGAFYNYWPRGGFQTMPLPASFQVGTIEVSGGTIRITPSVRKGKTFSVGTVAGVLVGPSNGSCVLYDKDRQVLAKFGTSWRNAELLIQYLQSWGVPFHTYGNVVRDGLTPMPAKEESPPEPAPESPLEPVPEPAAASRAAKAAVGTRLPPSDGSRCFSVPLRQPHAVATAGVIALGFLLAFVSMLFLFALAATFRALESLLLPLVMPLTFGLMLGPPIILTLAGQVSPLRLDVIGDRLYRQGLIREVELTDRIAGLRQEDNYWMLLDSRGKILAKFNSKDPEGAMLLEYLREHNINLIQKWAQERK